MENFVIQIDCIKIDSCTEFYEEFEFNRVFEF